MRGAEDNVAAWMPIYIADLFSDTDDLSPEEFGIYIRLLLHMWTRGGILPNDPQRLSRLARIDRATLDLVWPAVGKFFSEATGGLTQKRLALELGRARRARSSMLEKAQKGGKASGVKRKQLALGLEPEDEPQLEAEANPSSTSGPGPGPGDLPALSRRSSSDRPFPRLLSLFSELWSGIYFGEYMSSAKERSLFGRVLQEFPSGKAIEAYPWREVFTRYLADLDPFVAGAQRHSLAHFCSTGGVNKYRAKDRTHGHSAKEIRGMQAGGKFDEIMDSFGGENGRPTR